MRLEEAFRMTVIELLKKSTGYSDFKSSWHYRDWSQDSSSSGLLSPASSSPSRRGRSPSVFRKRSGLAWVLGLFLFSLLAVWAWSKSQTTKPVLPTVDDNGAIPIGESRSQNGREVFWWERYPRYVARTATCIISHTNTDQAPRLLQRSKEHSTHRRLQA